MPDITKSYKRATIRWQSTSNPSNTTETYIPISFLPENSKIIEYLKSSNQIKYDSRLNPNLYKFDNKFLISSLFFSLYLLFIKLFKNVFNRIKSFLRISFYYLKNIF